MINVTKTFLPERKKLNSYIDQIYESAWLTNNGPLVKKLEKCLKEYLGVKNLILVSNGTIALQLVYKALGLSGSAVTTPFSFVATASSLAWEGIQPVFADIDSETWNLEPEKIEDAIREDTTAIVPVHVFGNPCDVEKIDAVAKKYNLKVVYDAAHAFGVMYKGESILNWGDASTLSFHATKLFHSIEGGAIITSNDELALKIRKMINFGFSSPESIECLGLNAKMNEFQAAMGLSVFDEFDELFCGRRELWELYKENLRGEFVCQKWANYSTQNFHYFPILFDTEIQLEKTIDELKNNDIFPRRYFFPSLDTVPFFNSSFDMVNSRSISKRILCLPFYFGLKMDECLKIVAILKKQNFP